MLGLGLDMTRIRPSSGGAYQVETLSYKSAVIANGSTVADPVLAAANAFILGCKADGTWGQILRCNLFAAATFAGVPVPLVKGVGPSLDILTNFTSSDWSMPTGLLGDGSTKYIDTGVAVNSLTAGNRHLGAYQLAPGSAYKKILGADDSTANAFNIGHGNPWTSVGFGDGTSTNVATAIDATPGFICGSAGSSTTYVRSPIGTNSVATNGGANLTRTIFMFATDRGYPQDISNGRYGGYTIGAALTLAQIAMIDARFAAFNAAIGRS